VGDLLSEVATPHMASIPDMQLQALNRVLMREDDDGPETNQRMIATAFKSVVEALAVDTPTLIAVDDVAVAGFSKPVGARLCGAPGESRVGVLLTERHEHDHATAMSWLRPAATGEAMRLPGFSVEPKRVACVDRAEVGSIVSSPDDDPDRHDLRSNPLYALELARAIDADPDRRSAGLSPHTCRTGGRSGSGALAPKPSTCWWQQRASPPRRSTCWPT